MNTLTIFLRDQTKQVIQCNNTVLTDKFNKRLHPAKLKEKISDIARTVAGRGYLSHKFTIN